MNWIQNKPELLRNSPPDAPYLIGVSGGRDSVALLRQLIDCGYRKLVVCHLNHQLRARSSDADEHFVQKLAAGWHVDLELGSCDVRVLAKQKKLSVETAGREARYSFFARVAKRRRCHTIFIGHHADDLVETFLINLFRGAGTAGLAGLRENSTRLCDGVDLTIIRPLLGVWRSEIDEYIAQHQLKFREDVSNRKVDATRNRLRHRIIPYLEKELGRNIRQTIWRTATILAEEDGLIDSQLPPVQHGDLPVTGLRRLPVALQRRQILDWLHAGRVRDLSFEIVERVRALIDSGAETAKTNLPGGRHVRRRQKKLFITD